MRQASESDIGYRSEMELFIQNRRHVEGSRRQDHQQTGLPVDKLTRGQDDVN